MLTLAGLIRTSTPQPHQRAAVAGIIAEAAAGLLHCVEGTVHRRREVYRAINDELVELQFPIAATQIPARDDFEKSAILHEPLVTWRPDHIGSEAFRSLADELDGIAA
jgi:hypothetical protein